jgi:hypothetical protein
MKFQTKVAGTIPATLLLFIAATGAQAGSIPVNNYSFEAVALSRPGDYTLDNLPGWTWNGLISTFHPIVSAGGDFVAIPDGLNVAAVSSGVSISQTLSAVLTADTQYTLQVGIGNRASFYQGYMVTLSAGGTVLATDSSLSPGTGTFATSTISYLAPATGALIGNALTITLTAKGLSGQTEFDDVRLSTGGAASGTPEPGTWMLFGLGIAGVFVGKRVAGGLGHDRLG